VNEERKSKPTKPQPEKPQPATQTPPVPVEPGALTTAAVSPSPPTPAADPALPSKKERLRAEAEELLAVLAERFPLAFVRDWDRPVHPLAIGTRQALYALLPEQPKWKISRAINAYISRVRFEYLSALIEGQSRVDLEGNLGAEPTEAERERAKTELAEWQEKWRERKKQQAGQRRLERKKQPVH
jgi:sRNA-binding protein